MFNRNLLADPANETPLNFEQKLGHLYEDALSALIAQSPALELIDNHVQIFDGKRTLGELDYILRDVVRDAYIHLELAVKFYLALPGAGGSWRYPGPDDRDSWGRKRTRMVEHQFALSKTPQAHELLRYQYGIETIETQHLIYGCLFLPIDCKAPPTPQDISRGARTGRWLRVQDWDAHFTGTEDLRLIPKALWPVEITAEALPLFEPTTPEALMAQTTQRGVMFAVDDQPQPYFLVSKDWGS